MDSWALDRLSCSFIARSAPRLPRSRRMTSSSSISLFSSFRRRKFYSGVPAHWFFSLPVARFRSRAALQALEEMQQKQQQRHHSLVLYNYPSFSGAFAALFAHLYHSRLHLPFLVLPFSHVEPFKAEDFNSDCIQTCYLLDLVGAKGFALHLSRFLPRVVAFDHRDSSFARLRSDFQRCPDNLTLHIDTRISSARAIYHYFSRKLLSASHSPPLTLDVPHDYSPPTLLDPKDQDRVESLLGYLQDSDLRSWTLPKIKAFNVGLAEERSKLNCLTNPYMFDQLLELDPCILIEKGNSQARSRRDAAKKLLDKTFKIHLGRGLYGECLGIRADKNSKLSNEIGEELGKLSASAGLRPIGAVVFMQRGVLKICLRSTDAATDTSEIAKVYGGGGKPGSSSFVLKMDEYNNWTRGKSS